MARIGSSHKLPLPPLPPLPYRLIKYLYPYVYIQMLTRKELTHLFFLFGTTFVIAFLTNPAVVLLENVEAFTLTPLHIYSALLVASNSIWNFQIGSLIFFNRFNPFMLLFGLLLSATFIYLERAQTRKSSNAAKPSK